MDSNEAMDLARQAVERGSLSSSAAENLEQWLTQPEYAEYVPQVLKHVSNGEWKTLDDVFWTIIPFGTGGRRGRMYPIGCNAINDRTIGESARGLADYVLSQSMGSKSPTCAIAFDTRHRSFHFAQLCSGIMVAAGFQVFLLESIRSTPQLSYLVRDKGCDCGIMVTASHNPPSDNAVKVYWSTGGQVLPPHDKAIIDCVLAAKEIPRVEFDQAVEAGKIICCTEESDASFVGQVAAQSLSRARDVRILYSPLHGVGTTAVVPVLHEAGFEAVEVFADHAEPNGDFPNVPGHVSNPENPRVFDAMIDHARRTGADLALATDPDCDRMGCAAPKDLNDPDSWATFTGNQLAALLTDYVLSQRRKAGTLTPEHYVVKTLVTTDLIRRIADHYGVSTEGDLLVGFKWIGGVIDERGPDRFVFGAEESHGYLAGSYARDKDGALACLLMSEMAATLKAAGKSIHEYLDELFQRHGLHQERLVTIKMEGSQGMARMQRVMQRLREQPPKQLGGLAVQAVRDYLNQQVRCGETTQPLNGPNGNLVMLELDVAGNYFAARPSGTEPKIKFYLFTYQEPGSWDNLRQARNDLGNRLSALERDIRQFVDEIE